LSRMHQPACATIRRNCNPMTRDAPVDTTNHEDRGL
jgi:hypothetical protein